MDKSPEYWCGWILAYYQWRKCRSFKKIHQIIDIDEILRMYPTHHEADVERFVDTLNCIYREKHVKSYLQQLRENMDMDIKNLSQQAGIEEVLLKELERDFTKIQTTDAIHVFRLSQVLGCSMEALMEI